MYRIPETVVQRICGGAESGGVGVSLFRFPLQHCAEVLSNPAMHRAVLIRTTRKSRAGWCDRAGLYSVRRQVPRI